MKKHITIEEVRKEQIINIKQIINLENKLESLKDKQSYLLILEDYLNIHKSKACLRRKLLTDDYELEKFVLPLQLQERIEDLENQLAIERLCKKV